MKKVIAICGSTRKESVNLSYIQAITNLAGGIFEVSLFDGLADLPHFNPDNDIQPAPENVTKFRNALRTADGILICTPEYAMGVPGTLKNAIDWTVSSCEFLHKPVALVTASSQGKKAHLSWLDTLQIIESRITNETQLLISYAKTKININREITDAETLKEVNLLIHAFAELMNLN